VAEEMPMLLANDHRIKAAVLLGGGLSAEPDLPEVDQINFVTRVTTPLLMLNGRYDFVEPVESSQRPMFDLLETPAADKRHVIFETCHAVVTLQPMIKEVLEWLDRAAFCLLCDTNSGRRLSPSRPAQRYS
jgi:eukaryotic-like serine/threonine-protein kinase